MSIATTEPRTVPKTPARSRIGAVLQLHTVAWPLLIAWPVGILLISFLISFTIYAIVGNEEGEGFTGSVFSVYGFVLAFYLQSMTQTFPFALGLSVTRREFFTATTVMALAQSAVFAIALQLLSVLESATNGWGVHMRMFGIARYFTDNTAVQLLALFATLLLTSSIAMLAGAIYRGGGSPVYSPPSPGFSACSACQRSRSPGLGGGRRSVRGLSILPEWYRWRYSLWPLPSRASPEPGRRCVEQRRDRAIMCDATCRVVSKCSSDQNRLDSSSPSLSQEGGRTSQQGAISSPIWSALLPSHPLYKTRSPQHQFIFPVLARSGGIVAGIRERGVVTNIGRALEVSADQCSDRAATSTGGPGQLGAVEDDLVGESRVAAPGALGARSRSGLGLNEQDSDGLPVECRDDRVGASAHFRISPAQVVESVEVDGAEAVRQGEIGLLLTTRVDEAGTNRCIGQNDHGCIPIVAR